MPPEPSPSPGANGGRRPEVVFQNPCRYPEVRVREMRPWVEGLLAEVAPGTASFTVRFSSDREMRRLNRTYRDKDRSTDVLSFPGEETPEGDHLGDVVIAVPVARRQAEEAGAAVAHELRRLVLHGVLHCLGYDHETDDGAMERRERALARRWLGAEVAAGG